jgi:hypothetical protein
MLKLRRISGRTLACLLAVAVFAAQAQEGGNAPAYTGAVIVISSLGDLNKIGREPTHPLDGSYELGGPIDASASRAAYGAEGFEPIGKRFAVDPARDAFTGKFDGKGYEISGLFINRPNGNASGENIGLFGYVHGAEIQNVRLAGCDITGNKNVGALVGMSHSAAIRGCYSSGSVRGPAGEGADIGGLVGWLGDMSELSASYSMASVRGLNNVGGLVGNSNSSSVNRCYTAGAVSGTGNRAGGFIGYNDKFSSVSNSFSVAAVDGVNNVGGFVGANEDGSGVSTCYSAGAVKGSGESVGGFAGSNSGGQPPAFCYWDRDRSGMQTSPGGGVGRSTVQMGRAEMPGTAGIKWDLAAGSPWGMSNSFPYLKDLPHHTVTFTTTAGGTVAGGTAPYAQIANIGVDGGNVTAAVNMLEGGDQFDGWYLKGGSEKLAVEDYDGFSVADISDYGRTIALSNVSADVEIEARFIMVRYELVYIAEANGKILAEGETEAKEEYWVLVEYGKEGPKVTAVPDYGYRLQTWRDFDDDLKTTPVRSDIVTRDVTYRARFKVDPAVPPKKDPDPPPVSVLARDREIPQVSPDGEAIVIAPMAVTAGEFAAGPNPILKRSGAINIFWSGGALDDGILSIYDASGNLVKKISVRDKSIGISGKRQVSSWDLRDKKNLPVSEGTYLAKGTITTVSGSKEKVSIIIGVR